MKKKVLAAILAATMVMGSSMTAFADDVTTAGDTTITGSGEVVELPADVIQVALPANFDVVADPTGVYGAAVEAGGTLSNLDKADLANHAGKIVVAAPLEVNNKSSVPIKVTAVFKDASAGTTTATSIGAVDGAASDYNTWIAAVPSKTDIAGDVTSNYEAAEKGVAVTTAGTSIDMYLPNPVYLVSGSTTDNVYEQTIKEGEKGHGQAFDIFGLINKNADWSAATGFGNTAGNKIEISVKYTIAKAGASDAMDAALPYGFMTGATLVELGTAPSLGTTATWDKDTATVEMDCDLGTGKKATTVKSVWFGSASANTKLDASAYSVAGGKLTINAGSSWVDWTAEKGVKVWVELNDGTQSTTISCTAKP